MLKAPDILVPVDFSECSINAVRVAVGIAAPDGDVTLLHVIDGSFVDDAVAAALGTSEEITERGAQAERSSRGAGSVGFEVGVDLMIVVAPPSRDSQTRPTSTCR